MSNKITLYHYTDAKSAQSINENKTIYGSTDATPKKHQQFGKGVYFTSIDPYNEPKSILLNNYDDRGFVVNSKNLWSKIEWVIEVSIPENEVEKVADNRDVYLYEGDVDLNLYQHKVYKKPKIQKNNLKGFF